MKKKQGILTFHAAYNYGSCLQAYALQTFLNRNGNEFEIINYRPYNQKGMYDLINLKYFNKGVIIKNIYNLLHFRKILRRNKKYDEFIHKYYYLNSQNYLNESELTEIINNYYTIVCGSDQIWNLSKSTYDRSLVYYLEIGKKFKGNAIAYAPSFGDTVNNITKNPMFDIKYLNNFDYLSFREKDIVELMKNMGFKSTLVLDPTLLLSKKDWEKLIGPPIINIPYIFYYSLNCKEYSTKFVRKISEENNLPVITSFMHPRETLKKIKIYGDAGPLEFLNLLYYSTLVCSNSFHGIVFSIIFKKDFYAIFDEDKNHNIIRESRKASLLEQLDLVNHISSFSNYVSLDEIKKTNYEKVDNKLKKMQKISSNYLLTAIKEGKKHDKF